MLASSLSSITAIILALMAMAFYTLMERKLLGYFQIRKGPNKVSLMGIPQPFADAIKLFAKEQPKPLSSNKVLMAMAPMLSLILAMLIWMIYPHFNPAFFMKLSILYFLCVSSLNVYSTFIAGWSSNSKYAMFGAMRGIAQTISYEVTMAIIIISSIMISFSLELYTIMSNKASIIFFMVLPMSFMWFITALAETNRTPFDMAEGESELVSGFNIEYGGLFFAMIFMAEYMSILAMSLISFVIFFSLQIMPSLANMVMVIIIMLYGALFIWMRATLPRIRYDQLMYLTWKSFLPTTLSIMALSMVTLLLMI